MQQYSSLPEQNSQVDATIQQLRAELWLERSLNQLQRRLNDCLLVVLTDVAQTNSPEAEIWQTVAKEISMALNNSGVAIALCQPQDTVGKVYYISCPPSVDSQAPVVELMLKNGKTLPLKLQTEIKVKDLHDLETQKPPQAWRLNDESGEVIGWLLMAVSKLTTAQMQLIPQLMTKAAKHCVQTLVQFQHIQSLQQRSQHFVDSNQELKRTNQLKNQFLANTSHEIRTPLSSIIGFTHLLLAQGYDPTRERQREYLNIIQSSGKHLLALINDILDLSKIEANQLEVQWEKVDVPELCRNVLTLIKEKASNKGLKLSLEIDPEVTTLVADPLRLKQMLLNLLFNALKFTNKGSVGLQVTRQDSLVHFTVWDTGSGISKENQTLLFQPYFQIPNSSPSQNEGTGLGLAVTQKLAEIHHGYVEVESEVDSGSRFTIILPLKPMGAVLPIEIEEDEQATSSQPLAITPSTSNEILLVENDLPNGELMQIHLSKLGYQVTWVKNEAQMWDVLKDKQPDVILMDIRLQDSCGLDLVQQLREKPEYQQIPIIAQTAMSMKGDREICLTAGFNEYISKPLDLSLLADLVGKYSLGDRGQVIGDR
ncbi:hybrid histidine kinase/response regulator HrmK [Nostoc sp. UHCC 0870]|uniref:hybrid histidine kinase/response regulator HrmK n=1 Tax=Nostoc sp. UHCC 0870 TaxID=2914041 RepID=UPI001EDE5CAD|nr:hybrid histidine kinase/response regulator HrmK [Nostoc sp. UHCC 0870]UKO96415.1 hybrid histidine kinase/response regulator HrmK [Nostoc sp. UHCC 0870]